MGYLGASLLLADWWVRVFWSSGIIDRQSNRLYVRTINLSGYIYIHSNYIPFYSQAWLACNRKTQDLAAPTWRIIPLRHPPPGTTRALKIFRRLNCLGYTLYQNSILQELVVPDGVFCKSIILQVILTTTGVLPNGQSWLRRKGSVTGESVHAPRQINRMYV